MDIKVKEDHEMGDQINVVAYTLDEEGKEVYVYDRYIYKTDWDNDSELIAAEIADYLENQLNPTVSITTIVSPKRVEMTEAEVLSKLAEKELEKTQEK